MSSAWMRQARLAVVMAASVLAMGWLLDLR